MHRFLILFLLLASSGISAQDITWQTDLRARYLVVESGDTLDIDFGGGGSVLYSESPLLTAFMAESFRELIPNLAEGDSESAVMVNMERMEILLRVRSGRNAIAANVDITQLSGRQQPSGTETVRAISADRQVTVLGESYPVYALRGDTEEKTSVRAAFDLRFPMDYSLMEGVFSQFSGSKMTFDFPPGLLIYAENASGDVVLQLLEVRPETRKAHINPTRITAQ